MSFSAQDLLDKSTTQPNQPTISVSTPAPAQTSDQGGGFSATDLTGGKPSATAPAAPTTGGNIFDQVAQEQTDQNKSAPTATPLNSPDPNARLAVSGVGTISAPEQPKSFMGRYAKWLENVSDDIKYGTDHTGVGSVLKSLRAHGVYRGAPEAVGDFMASLPLGILKAEKGSAELTPQVLGGEKGHTWQGVKDLVGGGLQAVQIPASFAGPEVSAAEMPDAITAATGKVENVLRGGQPGMQGAIRNAAQTGEDLAEARSAAVRAAEPTRVHPPDIDPAVRDPARLNPFPGENVKIKTFPGTPATETEAATNPTARITGPNGSSIELELDGKIARVKSIINSGKPGDGQRLYDNAIHWAKDSGYDTFEGDKVQTQEGKTAWQRISERHNARLSDKGVSSIDLTGSRPAPEATPTAPAVTPSAGIRTSVEDVSNAVKAKSQGIYQQLDQASGGRWQRYDDALKNIQDKMDEVNGVDDDAYDRLETKRNDIETSQAQMIEDLKTKGIDPKTVDAAVAHYKQAMALRDLDKAVKASTTGDIASGATKSESVNPKAFTARIQKLYDSGRLKQAVGDSGAKALLQEAYAAKSAQAVQQVVKRIAMYAGIGAAMGAGAHATHIFNHLTGNVEP